MNGFVGMKVDDGTVVVYRLARYGPAVDKAVRERFPAARVRFVDSTTDEAALQARVDQITADGDSGYWRSRGVTIRSYGYERMYGVVNVDVAEDADVVRARLVGRYGNGLTVQGHAAAACFA